MNLEVGKTYQPEDEGEPPVTITHTTCGQGIYTHIGDNGESYQKNGMNLHIPSEFDLVREV